MKIIGLFDRLVFGKNNCNKPVFRKNNSNNKIIRFDINDNDTKLFNKIGKLKKLFKFKKWLKNGNLFRNYAIKRFNFLISNIRITFNYLWLAFIKVLIF